jgi:general secretion pathway protein M
MSSTGGSLKTLSKKLSQPIALNNSRLGAIGLLIVLILLGYFAVIYPLMGIKREYQENVDDLRFKLQHLQQVASGREALAQRLEQIRALAKQNAAFMPTNTAALASADLQTRIKQVVSDAGGELSSTQVIPERNEENAVRVGVKIRMTGSSGVLRQVLQNFESGKPYLFIDNLNIRPIRMPRNPRDKNPVIEDRLSVDFDVAGYMQAP